MAMWFLPCFVMFLESDEMGGGAANCSVSHQLKPAPLNESRYHVDTRVLNNQPCRFESGFSSLVQTGGIDK